MTSAVTPPHGHASPTASSRPVRATLASMVSVSSGLIAAQVDDFDLPAVGGEFLGAGERLMHHRAVGDDGGVAARPGDARLADGQRLGRAALGLEMVVEILVLAEDDRVVDGDGFEEHGVGVLDRRGRHDDEARDNARRAPPCSGCETARAPAVPPLGRRMVIGQGTFVRQ